MPRFFIRTKEQEAFVEADTLQDAYVIFVKETPIELLGLILIGYTEYFPRSNIPADAKPTRVSIPLVKAGIWSEEEAKDFNERLCGKRII